MNKWPNYGLDNPLLNKSWSEKSGIKNLVQAIWFSVTLATAWIVAWCGGSSSGSNTDVVEEVEEQELKINLQEKYILSDDPARGEYTITPVFNEKELKPGSTFTIVNPSDSFSLILNNSEFQGIDISNSEQSGDYNIFGVDINWKIFEDIYRNNMFEGSYDTGWLLTIDDNTGIITFSWDIDQDINLKIVIVVKDLLGEEYGKASTNLEIKNDLVEVPSSIEIILQEEYILSDDLSDNDNTITPEYRNLSEGASFEIINNPTNGRLTINNSWVLTWNGDVYGDEEFSRIDIKVINPNSDSKTENFKLIVRDNLPPELVEDTTYQTLYHSFLQDWQALNNSIDLTWANMLPAWVTPISVVETILPTGTSLISISATLSGNILNITNEWGWHAYVVVRWSDNKHYKLAFTGFYY